MDQRGDRGGFEFQLDAVLRLKALGKGVDILLQNDFVGRGIFAQKLA